MTHLRPAQPTDAGAVGAILSAFIDGTPWMPRIHTRAEDLSFAGHMIEKGWVTVAEQGGAVQAFCARNGADVHALYVSDTAQGQGIGAQLLSRMQAATDHLTLWTFQANTGAQRFYLRHGFAEAERTDGSRNDEGLPDIRYDWHKEGA
ncbi:GNAT family N-acetyltransferase [Tateyamaria sp. syn59]|uniref:GNAT family N-acetyltransferase n=1 Tax=Tateyamaria sp. syn59 TaxID=2576942 RepID=UPI0011BF4686|nr:GNAT family N-acetyltransferase [Tateyamaria sp. syn59]